MTRITIGELVDPFTGESFRPRTERHYEANDGVPVAPPVDTPRMSLRERVERLLYSGQALPQSQWDDDDPTDWSEDDGEPLTAAEHAYLEQGAALERAIEARNRAQAPSDGPSGLSATPPADPPAEGPKTPVPGQEGAASPPRSPSGG